MTAAKPPDRARCRRAGRIHLARLLRRALLLALVLRAVGAPVAIHHAGDARHGGGSLTLRVCAWPTAGRGAVLPDRPRWAVAAAPGPAAAGPDLAPDPFDHGRGAGRDGPLAQRHSPLRC